MWDRNFQLAFWSAAIYLPILIYDNPTDPFVGWSYVAVRRTRLLQLTLTLPLTLTLTLTLTPGHVSITPCLGQVLCANPNLNPSPKP